MHHIYKCIVFKIPICFALFFVSFMYYIFTQCPNTMEDLKESFKSYLASSNYQYFDLNALHSHSKILYNSLLDNPSFYIPLFHSFIPYGYTSYNSLTPKNLSSKFLYKLISLKGIITTISLKKQKLLKSVHYNHAKNLFYEKEYKDKFMISEKVFNTVIPLEMNGDKLSLEIGMSQFEDSLIMNIQEKPEQQEPGTMPRSVEVVVSGECNYKAGDRVKVYGVYKSIVMNDNPGVFPHRFRTVLIAYNIEYDNEERDDDTGSIKTESEVIPYTTAIADNYLNEPWMVYKKFTCDALSSLIAPSVFGHATIKKAILLLLLSGTQKCLNTNTKIRSSINILLIGDPSTAKSQILRFISNFTNCISTTGRGSTGVGLTACVTLDKETNEKRLEAGALVLSDNGICCIDEFDKMNDNDKVNLHEAMEQQTVSINKAGISVTLNARCSVLAAANPILGFYSQKMSVEKNLGLPVSLMTRFDLIFICIDECEEKKDRRIAERVMDNHSEKQKKRNKSVNNDSDSSDENVLFANSKNIKNLKKYLNFCKSLNPLLTRESQRIIVDFYVEIRQKNNLLTKVTPRMIETLIRLSCAHAKLRVSESVDKIDCDVAIQILSESLNIKEGKKMKEMQVSEVQIDEQVGMQLGDHVDVQINEPHDQKHVEMVNDALYLCRTMNDSSFLPVNDLLPLVNLPREEVIRILKELDAQEIILFEDDLITFYN